MFVLLAALARADDPPPPAPDEEPPVLGSATTYTGKPVALVTFADPNGGLPSESLEPLLRVQVDAPLRPSDVRQDLATLYQAGDFSQVEADIEPWPYGPDGAEEGVHVEYRLVAPARVRKLTITGNKALRRRALIVAGGLDEGDSWRDATEKTVRANLLAAYRAAGYPNAGVDVGVDPRDAAAVDVTLRIHEGAPSTVVDIVVPRQDGIGAGRVERLLAQAGLRRGHPLTPQSVAAAHDKVLGVLHREGWYEASVAVTPDAVPGGARVVVSVDPRRRWHIVTEGHTDLPILTPAITPARTNGLPNRRAVREALRLTEGVTLTRYFGDDAARALTEAEREQGFADADIHVGIRESPGDVTLAVSGSRGRMHVHHDVTVIGDAHYGARFVARALRDGLPDPLRRGPLVFGLGPYRVSPEGVDKAVEALADYYRAQGYPDVTASRKDYAPQPARGRVVPVDLTIEVGTGERVDVGSVELAGARDDIAVDDLFSSLVDAPFNPSLVADRCRQLVNLYRDHGYLDADAKPRYVRAADGHTVSVIVDVTPGPAVYLRSVIVRGYRRTRRWVVDREIDLHSGALLRPGDMSDIRKRLYDLGVFNRVSVDAAGDEDRVKDLVIDLDEAKNLFGELGGGIATDDGIKLTARGGHRNLWGMGHRLTAYGQVGLGWVGDTFGIDTAEIEWQAGVRYEAPHVPGRNERAALDILFASQDQEPTWRVERTGGGPSVQLRIGPRATAEIGYSLQWRRLLDLDPGLLVPGDPWLAAIGNPDLADPRPVVPSTTRIHSGIDVNVVLDVRNDTFNPTQGGIGSISAEVTDGVLSDVLYLKGQAAWSQLVPIAGKLSLLFRGRAGAAWVPGNTSALGVEDRFQLGGSTFRGFSPNTVGPANSVSNEYVDFPSGISPIIGYSQRDASARWVTTGGDAMAVGTVEVQVPFTTFGLAGWKSWQVALFTDIGNVWWVSPLVETDSMTRGTDAALRCGLGVGIRRSTPIGPIAVDVGFNPWPLDYRAEDLVKVHVSLGAL